ncbi:MAG: alpha-1,2-mannosidase [Bacteroidota bacterium]
MKRKTTILLGIGCCVAQMLFSCKKTASLQTADATTTTSGTKLKTQSGSMVVESLTGDITANEKTAFINYMAGVSLPATNDQNVWVFGNSGKQIEACGLMYDATSDQTILDRMIYLCDAALAGRNDLASAANGGQRTIWTGAIEPVWPSTDATASPQQAGVEQGQILSHMVFCAKLILQHSALWNTSVAIGDPHSFGATYKARALKYITEADYVMDNWITPRFVRTSDKKLYFPGAPNPYKPGDPAPWNQLFMVTNAMVRLVDCHLILADAASRVTQYNGVVQANIDWFEANLTANTAANGNACWNWKYALGGSTEDTNHFAYDAEGYWNAYDSGRYGITLTQIKTMANTYFDIVLATVTGGIYAGKVDGTTGTGNSGGDNYVRNEYYYLSDIRKDKYFMEANIDITTNKIASSPQVTSIILWMKHRRFAAGDGNVYLYQNCSYGGWTATFGVGNFLQADLVTAGGINDDASSIKVPPGMQVIVYTNNSYGGTAKTFTADDDCLSDNGINDMISSLKVSTLP